MLRAPPRAVRPSLALAAALCVALAAPAARAQDEDDPEPFVGDSIIPWDLPEDSDGVLEPNEMDVRALSELFDSLCAPPPPIETVHVGTFDAATGDFIWGEEIMKIPTLELLMVPMVDVDALFEDFGIEELHVDLDPAITGLGSLGLSQVLSGALSGATASGATASPATAAPKPKLAPGGGKGSQGAKPVKAGVEPPDQRLRGHPGDTGVMRTWCQAAKLTLLVDVVNRPAGHVPLLLTVDGVTVQTFGDSVDLIVPPRTRHEFAVSCGTVPEFADKLSISRPPLLGAFTLEALPVAIVYEPPGGSGCSQTWTQTHRVGTQIRSFQSDDSSATQPVGTPFSRVGDYIALLGGAGAAAASTNVPYVQQAGMAAQAASSALETAWGHSTTTETVNHAVTESHMLSFQLSETVSVSTTEGLGPGEGDVYYLLLKPTFAWMVTESQASNRLYVTATLLGYQGHATVSAKALRSHVLAMPPADVQDQLLGLDPLAAEYEAPTGQAFAVGKHLPSTGLGLGLGLPTPPRLQLLASPLIIVGGGSNTFGVSRMIEASDLVESQDIRTTTTVEEGGLLSFISKDVPQTGTRTLRVLGGRSTLSSVSDQVGVSVTLAHSSDEPLYLEAWYDRVFGTFAFKEFTPGMQAMSGTVADGGGLPKPAQEVKVSLPDGRGIVTQTDKQGHFEVRPPAGLKGPVLIESGNGRTRVEWDGTPVGGLVVRESPGQPLAKSGKKTKTTTKLPDPSTVPVTASEGTTATTIRGKPGHAEDPATIVPEATLKGRLGRLAVGFEGDAAVSGCRLDVLSSDAEARSLVAVYGTLAHELLPGIYTVVVSGVRVPGVEVRSGHESRLHVGVLRVTAGQGTRVDLFEPGGKDAFHSFYGGADVLLPPGRVEVAVAGMRDGIDVIRDQVVVF